MTRMRSTECDLHPVACIRVIDQWSMTRMRATECDLDSVCCIRVIDQIPKGHSLDLCRHTNWSMTQMRATECDLHSVLGCFRFALLSQKNKSVAVRIPPGYV